MAVAQLVTLMLDRRKAQRESEQRWIADRRAIYAEFMAAAQAVFGRVWIDWDAGVDPRALMELTDQAAFKRQEIQLIASADVKEAAESVFEMVLETSLAIEEPQRERSTVERLSLEMRKRRTDFVVAARRELGIEG